MTTSHGTSPRDGGPGAVACFARRAACRPRASCCRARRRRRSAPASRPPTTAGTTTPTARHTFLIGYYNRNWTAEVDVPIGPEQPLRAGEPGPRAADALPAESRLRHVHDHGAEGHAGHREAVVGADGQRRHAARAVPPEPRLQHHAAAGVGREPGRQIQHAAGPSLLGERAGDSESRREPRRTPSSGRRRSACRCRSTSWSRTTRCTRADRTRR